MSIDDFRDLWTASPDTYVLVKGSDPGSFLIYDPVTRMVELIDDDELHEQVVERMRERGFRTVDGYPP